MAGFSRERKAVLAAIIQAHRRRFRGWVLEGLRAVGSQTAMHLTVLLRLAATLNRSRDPAPLPAFTLVARDSTLALRFPEGWLAARAMTRADLAQEREYLAVAGFDFSFS
jgi:exopolyphosphatase/guanosine-5'-triphosphate,3'-diphosphate pyrophosphatase